MKVKIIDGSSLLTAEDYRICILVHSYEEYERLGGERNKFDTYAHFKEKAKYYESLYVQYMDMDLSGIDVSKEAITTAFLKAQIFWDLLTMWFDAPHRVVSYLSFDLQEFNNL